MLYVHYTVVYYTPSPIQSKPTFVLYVAITFIAILLLIFLYIYCFATDKSRALCAFVLFTEAPDVGSSFWCMILARQVLYRCAGSVVSWFIRANRNTSQYSVVPISVMTRVKTLTTWHSAKRIMHCARRLYIKSRAAAISRRRVCKL